MYNDGEGQLIYKSGPAKPKLEHIMQKFFYTNPTLVDYCTQETATPTGSSEQIENKRPMGHIAHQRKTVQINKHI